MNSRNEDDDPKSDKYMFKKFTKKSLERLLRSKKKKMKEDA